MERQHYFMTSEFARICGVTKETLRHYDDIGLLKPELVNDKGYRFYSAQQFFTYDVIYLLRQAHSPLKEIREYLQDQNTPAFLQMMRRKQIGLENEVKRLRKSLRQVDNIISMTEEALHSEYRTPQIIYCDAEPIAVADFHDAVEEKDRVNVICDYFEYGDEHDLEYLFPLGSIIAPENLEKGEYHVLSSIFNKVPAGCCDSIVQEKPAGFYAVIDHKGSYEKLPESYGILKTFIASQDRSISGCAYELEMLSYAATGNPDNYIIRLAVQVT